MCSIIYIEVATYFQFYRYIIQVTKFTIEMITMHACMSYLYGFSKGITRHKQLIFTLPTTIVHRKCRYWAVSDEDRSPNTSHQPGQIGRKRQLWCPQKNLVYYVIKLWIEHLETLTLVKYPFNHWSLLFLLERFLRWCQENAE